MQSDSFLHQLNDFIVGAKAATYVGDGKKIAPCRIGSHDLAFDLGDFSYLDSYFGGTDFIGEEVVYFRGEPVWAMNYYGQILNPEKINAAEAGAMIKASLSLMYKQGRFLGGFEHREAGSKYTDSNTGDLTSFTGTESISREGEVVYQLVYHGGLIKQ